MENKHSEGEHRWLPLHHVHAFAQRRDRLFALMWRRDKAMTENLPQEENINIRCCLSKHLRARRE